jgi:WD40 repeat protein/serine/threonine protein kinase
MEAASLSTYVEVSRSTDRSLLGVRIGQYEIIRLLGRGGMGEVFLARDLRLGRLVAVKLLIGQQPDLAERFLVEARATARCHHENIVVIYEVGEHRGDPYMVLEYLEGQTLRQWLRDHAATTGRPARVPPARAVELMLPVVRALVCAHDQGIVHRDLKPENVMLTRAGAIKVLDFGIAKLVASGPEAASGAGARLGGESSSLAGTRPYMSPEQTALDAVDHRTDLWAVGIMLFELITGAHPVLDAALPLAIAEFRRMSDPNERVPDVAPLAQVIERCLIVDPAHRTASARVLLGELEALTAGSRPVPVISSGSPFAGLAAFQEADVGRFFGRDRDIEHVVAELRSRPLVTVAGPSGTGKSSLVRAGVIPALKRSGEGWDAHIVRPGREPLAALAGIIAQLDSWPASASHTPIDRLRAEPGYLGARLRAYATSKRRHIALFVDQLEELYTLGLPPAERADFLACLAAVADDAASPLRVLMCMRSDFLDRLTEDRRLGTEITRGLILLAAMDRDGMREALLRPVEATEHRFESALVDRMIDAVAATRGALPLLQFTAAHLWECRDRDRRLLTEASYEQLGGVAGALATHADTVLAAMSATQQALARSVLERLVTPERTRAVVSVAELHALRGDPGVVDGVLQHLTAMRLVVIERGSDGADPTVELVHESLIDRWPTLARWLDDNQDDAAIVARLRAAARDWERSGLATGLLWTGDVAREACAWHQRHPGELAPVEQRYLFSAAVSTAVLTAMVMAWLAWKQTQAGHRAADEAMRARDATRMAAMRALAADPTTQLALLREIEDLRAPPPDADREAKRLLYAGVAPIVLVAPAEIVLARFSPDGRRIVGASVDSTVRVWSADGRGEPLVLRGHGSWVTSVAFSPDGQRIVSSAADKTVRIWNADGRGDPAVFTGHDDTVQWAEFSPDGGRIVSASWDRTVRVWSADQRGEPLILRGHGDRVNSAAFSPDGQRIVSASSDETVRVWSADGTSEPVVLRGHDGEVQSASFSPDGQRIVAASNDHTVRVWRADGRGEPLVLRGHRDRAVSAVFSPDGRHILSASWDKTMRVWNADGSGESRVLPSHDDRLGFAVYSPDARHLLSVSVDKTLRIWNVEQRSEPLVLRGHHGWVSGATFSPDGRRILSASTDKTIRIWDADGRGEPVILRGHDSAVDSAEFSPDGRYIVSASMDRTVRVWSAEGRGELLVLRGHDDEVRYAAFSPDSRRIVSASADKTVRVWSADGREPVILRGHDAVVDSAVFTPDGRRIVSASWDKTVRVWSADGRGEPIVLRGHDALIRSAAVSPDGRRVASASADKTVRIWNIDGVGDPVILRGHNDMLFWAEFSPDSRRIVSACRDKALRIWQADGASEPIIVARSDYPLVQARFSPDGQRIVAASIDHTIFVWRDLASANLEDPRLWAATSYCMSVERRIELLGNSAAQAVRDRERCIERVERVRRSSR